MKPDSTDPAEEKAPGLAPREIRTCPACGTKFSATGDREFCPVCALLRAAGPDSAPAETVIPLSAPEHSSAETEPAPICDKAAHEEALKLKF